MEGKQIKNLMVRRGFAYFQKGEKVNHKSSYNYSKI
jgi:hypothetical protein